MSLLAHPPTRYIADGLTLLNGVFGFLAILTLSVELGAFTGLRDPYVAAAYIGAGMVADGLDGIAARRWGSTGMGDSLDLMSDAITFALAPAVLILTLQGSDAPLMASLAASAVLVLGMIRLARNNEGGKDDVFVGLPTPWSGGAITIVALLQWDLGFDVRVPLVVALVLAALNVSRVPYPKTRGPALTRLVVAILATAVAVVVGIVFVPRATAPILVFAAVLAAAMILVAPRFAPR